VVGSVENIVRSRGRHFKSETLSKMEVSLTPKKREIILLIFGVLMSVRSSELRCGYVCNGL
jgi:hypothetical protein